MKILVGFDGSNVSREAVKTGVRFASQLKARLLIVMSMFGGPDVPRDEFARNEKELEFIQTSLVPPEVESEIHLSVRGMKPGEDLVSFAREHKADLMIIGVKRRSKVGKLVFGSNAQYVILQASCPVMSVK